MANPVATPVSLHALLSNPLMLHQICPLLPLVSIFALGATSKAFRALIWKTPLVFRRLDLSPIRFMSDPSHLYNWIPRYFWPRITSCLTLLAQRNVLRSVSTLVLDSLPVPGVLLTQILREEPSNIRLLSIRGITRLEPESFRHLLLSLVRSSRQPPNLQGVYYFGPVDRSGRSFGSTVFLSQFSRQWLEQRRTSKTNFISQRLPDIENADTEIIDRPNL